MSLYTLPKKKKKKRPFASHKQFRIQLRKHRVNHMAGVARVGCIFPQTKKGLRVEGKEKKTTFRLMKLLSGGNDPKSQGFIPGSD